ncbi:MAG: hypothetical protein JWQ98_3375 [Chlorobi bacterium]|nr:hypothetical protein [Chlorobiota bacterium]
MNFMNIILTAVDEPLAYAWESFCGDLDFVTIHRGNIHQAISAPWLIQG